MKQKELVGKEAADLVKNGMVVGLGTGSTVFYTLQALGEKKLDITCVATSKDTEEKAAEFGIKIVDIDSVDKIDIAIDGADEVDKDLNLIKGGGGALTREKIIDYLAESFVVITDESKMSEVLGSFPLPVEVLQFGWQQTKKKLEALGCKVTKRDFVTDNGNFILDCKFESILKPAKLERIINNVPGIVENGIFRSENVSEVWVGTKEGVKKHTK